MKWIALWMGISSLYTNTTYKSWQEFNSKFFDAFVRADKVEIVGPIIYTIPGNKDGYEDEFYRYNFCAIRINGRDTINPVNKSCHQLAKELNELM
jgi:hypothetical protein